MSHHVVKIGSITVKGGDAVSLFGSSFQKTNDDAVQTYNGPLLRMSEDGRTVTVDPKYSDRVVVSEEKRGKKTVIITGPFTETRGNTTVTCMNGIVVGRGSSISMGPQIVYAVKK